MNMAKEVKAKGADVETGAPITNKLIDTANPQQAPTPPVVTQPKGKKVVALEVVKSGLVFKGKVQIAGARVELVDLNPTVKSIAGSAENQRKNWGDIYLRPIYGE